MQEVAFQKKSAIVIDKNSFAEVCVESKSGIRFLRSLVKLKKDSIITSFKAHSSYSSPNCFTIQTNQDTHVSLFPYCLKYTNHSCDPNVFFDTENFQLVALRDVEPGEELVYFYPSTELEMAQPFLCNCGSKDCLGEILGARFLSKEVLNKYKLSDFIKNNCLDK